MNARFSKPFTFDRVVRLMIGAFIVIAICYALHYFKSVLLPFFIAWLLAYLLYPMVKFVQFKLHFKSRALSVLAVLSTLITIIVGAIWYLVPLLITEIIKAKNLIINYGTANAKGTVIPYLKDVISNANLEQLFDKERMLEAAQSFFPHAWEILSGSLSLLISFLLVFVVLLYLFFILKDYHKIANGFLSMIPAKKRKFVSDLMKDMESSMNRYYRGQASVAMIVGILFCIGFSIIGLPLALLMGLLLGVLNLIPYMQVLSFPPVILLMLLRVAENGESPWWPLISLALVYIIVQIIQDGYLVPKILGKAMGLNPAVILLSLSIWGVLLGVLGLIIALPATTLIISYYKRYVLAKPVESEEPPEQQE
jgi:predicted PurR-regulated permease PerM